MDPNACVNRIIDAIERNDYTEVAAATEDLLERLDSGFQPDLGYQIELEKQLPFQWFTLRGAVQQLHDDAMSQPPSRPRA